MAIKRDLIKKSHFSNKVSPHESKSELGENALTCNRKCRLGFPKPGPSRHRCRPQGLCPIHSPDSWDESTIPSIHAAIFISSPWIGTSDIIQFLATCETPTLFGRHPARVFNLSCTFSNLSLLLVFIEAGEIIHKGKKQFKASDLELSSKSLFYCCMVCRVMEVWMHR